jgi:hypothetical protein
MTPTRARRGQTAIFLLANDATSSRVFAIGDASLTHHRGTGFAVKLARNERKRVLMYLDYRGPLPSSIAAAGKTRTGKTKVGKPKVVGVFFVT